MNVANCAAAHEFAVVLVLHKAFDFHTARLIHLVALNHADDLSFGHLNGLPAIRCYLAATVFFSRCVWSVLMRETSRRLRRNSLGASSFSVCCLIRKRNRFSLASLSVNPSCSSLMSRSSVILAIA